jgi:protein-tyrosine phosphatase
MNLDGGVHRIPLRSAGALWLCGKHAIAPDPEALFTRVGVGADDVDVVCLVEEHELAGRYPDYLEWLRASSTALWFPVHDLSSPEANRAFALYDEVWRRLEVGRHVIAHCGAGMGRAGTLGVAMCLYEGQELEAALEHVRRHRPGAGPEVGAQMEVVGALAARLAMS